MSDQPESGSSHFERLIKDRQITTKILLGSSPLLEMPCTEGIDYLLWGLEFETSRMTSLKQRYSTAAKVLKGPIRSLALL